MDYAKQTENGYIMNFFANSVEDLEDISEGKEFVTKNGTNYGVPAPQSVVTITNKNGEKTTYLMGEDGNWIPGVVNPTDYYTKKQADEKFAGKEEVKGISQNVSTLDGQVSQIETNLNNKQAKIYKHQLTFTSESNLASQKGYACIYSSNNTQINSLADLKAILGNTFQLPVYGQYVYLDGGDNDHYFDYCYVTESKIYVRSYYATNGVSPDEMERIITDVENVSWAKIRITDTVTAI